MKNTLVKAGIPLAVIIVAIGVMIALISARKPPEQSQEEEVAFLVSAEPVSKEDITYMVQSQGSVSPRSQTMLSAQVSGRVTYLSPVFIEGGMFKAGDVLLQIEQADYATDLKLADAELAGARAALQEEQARGKVAEQEWKSVNSGVPPELGLRKPQLAKEIANVRAAEAQVERAKRNLERTSVKAPYDGLVKSKTVDVGQFVTLGTQLGLLYSTEVAEVRMPLSDNDLAYLELPSKQDGETQVILKAKVAGKSVSWMGRLARNEGVLDEQSRVIYAIAEVPDPYKRIEGAQGLPLKFGRFVQASITGNNASGLVVLPRSSVRLDGSVLVVGADRKLQIRSVVVQRVDEKYAYISAGLEHGELVTSSAVPNPYEGMNVRLSTDKKPALKDEKDDSSSLATSNL